MITSTCPEGSHESVKQQKIKERKERRVQIQVLAMLQGG